MNPSVVSTQLPPGQQLAARDKWPVVGERSAQPPQGPWLVEATGLVARAAVWNLSDLAALGCIERTIDLHCVTRWTKLGVRLGGVPLRTIVDAVQPHAAARFVSFVAYSQRDHSTSLPLADALGLDALIVLSWDGQPLPAEHGGPVRVVVPGRYLYKSLKWLRRIELLAEDRLGFWEAQAGYHNVADPWLEQRYLAANLTRLQVHRLLKDKNLSGQELLALGAAGLQLPGLRAAQAVLRAADFTDCDLRASDFAGTNLTNARFDGAHLQGANFQGAGLEGASLVGADLRGADLRGASLIAATFAAFDDAGRCTVAARLDRATQCDPLAAGELMPRQAQWLQSQLQALGASA